MFGTSVMCLFQGNTCNVSSDPIINYVTPSLWIVLDVLNTLLYWSDIRLKRSVINELIRKLEQSGPDGKALLDKTTASGAGEGAPSSESQGDYKIRASLRCLSVNDFFFDYSTLSPTYVITPFVRACLGKQNSLSMLMQTLNPHLPEIVQYLLGRYFAFALYV